MLGRNRITNLFEMVIVSLGLVLQFCVESTAFCFGHTYGWMLPTCQFRRRQKEPTWQKVTLASSSWNVSLGSICFLSVCIGCRITFLTFQERECGNSWLNLISSQEGPFCEKWLTIPVWHFEASVVLVQRGSLWVNLRLVNSIYILPKSWIVDFSALSLIFKPYSVWHRREKTTHKIAFLVYQSWSRCISSETSYPSIYLDAPVYSDIHMNRCTISHTQMAWMYKWDIFPT